MTDGETPVQPDNSGQQANPNPAPASGENINWEARYKGSVTKINELQATIKTLTDQITVLTSDKEQLAQQLNIKDVEKDAAVGEYKKQLEQAVGSKSQADRELAELRAMKAKLDMARKLEAPQLVQILDRIPYVEDEAALETIMKDFMNWRQEGAKEREKQILAGVTPGLAGSPAGSPAMPNSAKDWEAHINALPLGEQREKAWNDYFEWGKANGTR